MRQRKRNRQQAERTTETSEDRTHQGTVKPLQLTQTEGGGDTEWELERKREVERGGQVGRKRGREGGRMRERERERK